MVTIRTPLILTVWVAVILGVAPLFPYLDRPLQIGLLAGLGYAILADWRRLPLLAAPVATGVALLVFFWYASGIGRSNIVGPVVNILALLLVMRLLTEKSSRHLLQLFMLSLLALAASSLYSLSSAFLAYLGAEVICVALGLVLLSFVAEDGDAHLPRPLFRQLLWVGCGLPLAALVALPFFFFILPRTQTPLWNFLNQPATTASAGLSERLEPGGLAQLATSRRTVLRVESPALSRQELYWRATVLNTPQGRAWVRTSPPAGERALLRGGRTVHQELYAEARGDRMLPALDVPYRISGLRAELSRDGLLVAARTLEQRSGAAIDSQLGGRLQVPAGFDPRFYLQLPEPIAPRLRAVAAEIVANSDDARQRVALCEAFLLRQGLTYNLSSRPGGSDPLDDFLFVRKAGYCEHFAAAFATLVRLCGVPSRLVGGYYGGEYNGVGGYYLINEENAHVWVEVLLERSWERFDPTRLARNAASVGARGTSRLSNLGAWLDAGNYYWNRLVVNYDLAQQVAWLQQGGEKVRSWRVELQPRQWLLPLGVATGVILLAILGVGWWRMTPEERLLRAFLRRLRQQGVAVDAEEHGLQALAEQSGRPAALAFARLFNGIVFNERRATREERRQLRALLRELGRR